MDEQKKKQQRKSTRNNNNDYNKKHKSKIENIPWKKSKVEIDSLIDCHRIKVISAGTI